MAWWPSKTSFFGSSCVIGLGLLLVAITGLTAFQARAYPGLSWAAFGMLVVGTIVAFIGFFGAWLGRDGFWNFGALGVLMALVGTMLFAIATYRTAALSRGAAVLLGVGAALPFLGMVLGQVMLMPVAMALFLIGWFLLGLQAIRLDSPATDPRPA